MGQDIAAKFSNDTVELLGAYSKARQHVVEGGVDEMIVTGEGNPECGVHSIFVRLRQSAEVRHQMRISS